MVLVVLNLGIPSRSLLVWFGLVWFVYLGWLVSLGFFSSSQCTQSLSEL